jgi:hypothetical protein
MEAGSCAADAYQVGTHVSLVEYHKVCNSQRPGDVHKVLENVTLAHLQLSGRERLHDLRTIARMSSES